MSEGNQVYAILQLRKKEIIDSWIARVRNRVDAARNQEKFALIDSLPIFLDKLSQKLELRESGDSGIKTDDIDLARDFGNLRAQLDGYNLAQIGQEYAILRDVLFETIEDEAILRRRDRSCILEIIDSAIHHASEAFIRASTRKEQEDRRALKISEDRYRMIVEEVDEYAVFMIDPEGHVASWNKGTLRVKGYEAHEIIGQPFRVLFTEEDVIGGRPEWEMDFAAKHGRYTGEGWRRRKDGSRFWASVVLTVLKDEDKLLGWVKITRDITEDKRLQEALRKAEDASTAKNIFVANISHEIRTPLGAISGYAELIQDPTLSDDERRQFAETIKRNSEQLGALIDDILDMSKIEAGELRVEKERIEVREFLEDLRRTFGYKAREKGITFEMASRGEVPVQIYTDRLRLRQILLNIIGNAIKFTDRGSVRLEIENQLAAENSLHNRVRFAISDSGIGIDPSIHETLFQPFMQAHVSNRRLFGGTGLGLALSRNLAKALGGDLVLVDSYPGKGSCFALTIDAGPGKYEVWTSDIEGKMEPVKQPNLAAEPDEMLTGLNLLVAEDAPDIQKMIERFLTIAGAKVDIVPDGLAAVERAQNGDYDLVLMDIQMPVMNGHEAARQLRQQGFEKPIIALTAFAMKEERERSREAGFSDYLTKPINRAAMLSTVVAMIRKAK